MNKREGHYIINLQRKMGEKNEGYINEGYTLPPGNLDFTQTTDTEIIQIQLN